MSKLSLYKEERLDKNQVEYTVVIPSIDMISVKLYDFDKALFDDIDHGEPSKTPIADKLLGLETLVRRIEEQS